MASRAARRTKSGGVSAQTRKQYGMKSKTATTGSFPIFDRQSAVSALKLRGRTHSKKDRLSVINRARKFAPGQARLAYARDKKLHKI